MSEIMALYPGLYPEHAVGLVRAGEVGGFVPEACAGISEQAGAAQRFRMWHWPLWYAFYSMMLLLPGVALGMLSFNRTFWKALNGGAHVSSSDILLMYRQSFVEELRGPAGAIIFGSYVAIILFLWLLNKPGGKRLRHGMGLRFPIYGKRATHEGVTIFSWALSLLARSGIPPQTAWALASQCVPNVRLRDRLVQAGRIMQTGSRVSEAAFRSGLFPVEYAPTVTTGEMTGDVPGTLERLAQISRGEFESQTKYALWRMGCFAALLVFVAQVGGIVVLYYIYSKLCMDVYNHGLD
jgi:type II secretory pathway component PulF